MSTPPALLRVEQIEVCYEQVILALRGVSLEVGEGQVVALLGANGAGKSTTLKAISNLIVAERGFLTAGRIEYRGQGTGARDASRLVADGLVQVLEGRHCFRHLSVEQNLLTGAYVTRPSRHQLKMRLELIYSYFPRLKLLRTRLAGYASGGEQQMLAIGRALMSEPRLLLLDEPSMGLAPQIVEDIFCTLSRLNIEQGLSLLIAEQNIGLALHYADYAYVMENGRVVDEGAAEDMAQRDNLLEFYLGAVG